MDRKRISAQSDLHERVRVLEENQHFLRAEYSKLADAYVELAEKVGVAHGMIVGCLRPNLLRQGELLDLVRAQLRERCSSGKLSSSELVSAFLRPSLDDPEAQKAVSNVLAIFGTMRGYSGSAAKNARDPKQTAKTEAFKLWQNWQAGRARHTSGAAFARHVVETFDAIESTKTVERWVTQWRRDAGASK